jgi:hypothetical protein
MTLCEKGEGERAHHRRKDREPERRRLGALGAADLADGDGRGGDAERAGDRQQEPDRVEAAPRRLHDDNDAE